MKSDRPTAANQSPILILRGGDFSSRTGAKPVVVSHCSLRLKSPRLVANCEAALMQFERLLRERPDNEIKYEWANMCKHNKTVTFDVLWYEIEFFEDRKAAYLFGAHPFVFQRFGADPEELEIVHEHIQLNKSK